MSITTNKVAYKKSSDEEPETVGTEKIPNEGKTGGGNLDSIPKAIFNMAMPKQLLILAMAVYGIIAYSKGNTGVNVNDLALFIIFIIFIVVIFGVLIISKYFWNYYNKIYVSEYLKFDKNSLKKVLILIIFFFLTGVLLAVIFKLQILTDFIKNIIQVLVN